MWGYNSKPLHEGTGYLNGRRLGVFVRYPFERIRCVRRIKVNALEGMNTELFLA